METAPGFAVRAMRRALRFAESQRLPQILAAGAQKESPSS
jgi:hypothetical protein